MNLYSALRLARLLLECFKVLWLNDFDVKNVVEIKKSLIIRDFE